MRAAVQELAPTSASIFMEEQGGEIPDIQEPGLDSPQSGWVDKLTLKAEEMYLNMSKRSRVLGSVALSGLALGGMGAASASAETAPGSLSPPTSITEQNKNLTLRVGSSRMSAESFSKATVLGNSRTISVVKMKKAEKQGNCKTLDGSEQNIWTEGRKESGKAMGKDTRISRFCKVGDKWYRKACGNLARFKLPKNAVRGSIIWVQNFSKAKVHVSAVSTAKAQAECKSPDGTVSAYAYGQGEGKASASLRILTAVKAKGRALKELIVKKELEASGTASSSASAQAIVKCASSETGTPNIGIPNSSPTIDLVDQQHNFINGRVQVCAVVKDPDGPSDIASRSMTEGGDGNFLSEIYNGNEEGEFCRDFAPGTSAGTVVITAAAIDKAGNSVSDTETWPIINDNTTPGQDPGEF